ncbi:hypothetical protein NWF24_15800 [Variovorax paradoxus]|uniref:hypothetical protein n=1 Tax=Variovorax TaxID=34072 RepID=UPI00089A68D6|nr:MULTISPECIES: hypothetical protein [Variovorax]UVH60822.1 hypothetical protein NWF24_15800 [Variovorax paradoxus]SDY72481.1 hypothetical protein SAMN05518854_102377 [Variovorax sp. YR266]
MRIRNLLAVIAAVISTGCTTVVVDRAQSVATAGKAYAETLGQVNELALENSISFNAVFLSNEATRNPAMLNQTTALILERRALVGEANVYFRKIGSYFEELGALAKDDQSAATAASVEQVADALKKEPVGLKLSDEKKKSLSGLAGFVAKQVHAAAVERALRRDAVTVGEALALSEKLLDEEIRWIAVRAEAERAKAYKLKVEKPYLDPKTELGAPWRDAWTAYVKTTPVIEILQKAKKASVDMQKQWITTLRGDYSAEEIKQSLANIKAGAEAIKSVKSAY